ncbi:MAG TPA: hypothetical protein VM008_22070 [Phycisphaerae bacterium]|nr:hypothetical protein [Phycisphaerae bacterium]
MERHRLTNLGTAVWAVAGAMMLCGIVARADDDVSDLLGGAKTVTTAPAEVTGPGHGGGDVPDALGTLTAKAPAGAREGTVVLNDGTKISGEIWTTLATPLRVWVEATKRYVDVDLSLVSRVEVKVLHESMEDDWRWLKEGSDQKIFSGKKYPLVELEYVFTLVNGQKVEGGVVAPIYVLEDGTGRKRALALYKKYKGKLDETLKDVAYIKTMELKGDGAKGEGLGSGKLPLIY